MSSPEIAPFIARVRAALPNLTFDRNAPRALTRTLNDLMAGDEALAGLSHEDHWRFLEAVTEALLQDGIE